MVSEPAPDKQIVQLGCYKPSAGYPVTVSRYTEKEIACVNAAIEKIIKDNPESWFAKGCHGLNAFGELSYQDRCLFDHVPASFAPSDTTSAVEQVTHELEILTAFVPVTNETVLANPRQSLNPVLCGAGCERRFQSITLMYESQILQGFEVINSKLRLEIQPGRFQHVISNWRADIIIPSEAEIDEVSGRKTLIGTELLFYDFAGEPQTVTITPNAVGSARLVVYREETDNKLSYHLAWQYPISGGDWLAYVDAITGKVIEIRQMFMT